MRKMLLMLMVSLCVMSCSNIPEEREVTASNVGVTGFIKDYIEVVDGSYKFTNDGKKGQVTVKLKLKEQPSEVYHIKDFPKIRINAVGENGEIFDTGVYGFEAQEKEFDKVKELLENGKAGDTASVSFTWQYLGQDEDLASKIFNEATTFEIIDGGFAAGEKPVEEKVDKEASEEGEDYDAMTEEDRLSAEADASEESGSKSDYDKWLDEYEDYFKTLVKLSKKVQNGDQSAYLEYAELMQKAQSIATRLHDAEAQMTPAQTARLYRIIQKYSQEIQQ